MLFREKYFWNHYQLLARSATWYDTRFSFVDDDEYPGTYIDWEEDAVDVLELDYDEVKLYELWTRPCRENEGESKLVYSCKDEEEIFRVIKDICKREGLTTK